MKTVSYKHLEGYFNEFFRLRDLPLPVPDYHEHYLDMWVQHDPIMHSYIKEFNEYLLWCEEQGCTPQQNRVDSKERFLKWANEKGLINKLKWDNSGTSFQKLDRRKEFHGNMLLSIDMRKANFSILKMVAVQRNGDIHESWEDLCEALEIHPVLAGSKVFRQHCFGEYEPAKIADMQRHIIGLLVEKLELKDQLVYCSHDEVVIPCPDSIAKIKADINKEFGLHGPVQFRLTPYKTTPIYDVVIDQGDENLVQKIKEVRAEKNAVVLKQRYEEASKLRERERELMDLMRVDYDKQVDEQSVPKNLNMSYSLRREYELKGGEFYERKKMLFGVPTNKFYLYFRSVLLREPWDDKDLTFRLDGMNAIWQPKRE
jgi:hypothetical protein